jgi:hypothetical protein
MNQPPSPGRARPPTTNEEKTQARRALECLRGVRQEEFTMFSNLSSHKVRRLAIMESFGKGVRSCGRAR